MIMPLNSKDSIELITEKNSNENEKDVIFKVQISTSLKAKNLDDIAGFKVEKFIENSVYKYTIGNEISLEAAKLLRNKAIQNGYNDAFVIAFLKNEKVSISDALNYQNLNK